MSLPPFGLLLLQAPLDLCCSLLTNSSIASSPQLIALIHLRSYSLWIPAAPAPPAASRHPATRQVLAIFHLRGTLQSRPYFPLFLPWCATSPPSRLAAPARALQQQLAPSSLLCSFPFVAPRRPPASPLSPRRTPVDLPCAAPPVAPLLCACDVSACTPSTESRHSAIQAEAELPHNHTSSSPPSGLPRAFLERPSSPLLSPSTPAPARSEYFPRRRSDRRRPQPIPPGAPPRHSDPPPSFPATTRNHRRRISPATKNSPLWPYQEIRPLKTSSSRFLEPRTS